MIAPAHPDSAPSGLRPGGGIRFASFDWGEYEYEYTHRYVEKDLPATYVNQPNWLQRRRSHQLSTVRRAEKVGKSSRKCCMGSRRAFYEQIMEKIMRSPAMWHENKRVKYDARHIWLFWRYVSYLSNWIYLVLYVYCAKYRAFLSTAYVPSFLWLFPVLALPSYYVEVR